MSNTETIRALVVEPGKEPDERQISPSLESMQALVGGHIESVPYRGGRVTVYANEEGLLLGLPPNRHVGDNLIVGTFVVLGTDEDGDAVSLTDEQLALARLDFALPRVQREPRAGRLVMTPSVIEARVATIAKISRDDEAAHAAEDELRADVLTAIAEGRCADPRGCAEAALKSSEIDFGRFCA